MSPTGYQSNEPSASAREAAEERAELRASGLRKISIGMSLSLTEEEINAFHHLDLLDAYVKVLNPMQGRRATERETIVLAWLEEAMRHMEDADVSIAGQRAFFAAEGRRLRRARRRAEAGEDNTDDESEGESRRRC